MISTPPLPKENIKFENKKEYEIDNIKLKISYNKELMFLEIEEIGEFPKKEYNTFANIEQLRKIDNYFLQFDSLEEICESFKELIRLKNLSILKDGKCAKIKINNPIIKKKEFYINLPIKEKDIKNEIESIISYVNKLDNKISSMKNEYDNKISLLENKIKQLEEKFFEREKKEKEEIIDSKIFGSRKDLSFLNQKLENIFNSKVKYDLIYRATRDGPNTSDFNRKCNGKNNQLIVIKTTKGIIFGGYTGRGFQNTNNLGIIDDSVFLFSFNTNKIYNIKKGSVALYEDYNNYTYGIFFGKCDGDNPIFLGDSNMLLYNSYTCGKSNDQYSFSRDFEINNGEQYFTNQEIEVFQINIS